MPSQLGTERIHALDALRAVAMFLGIALHAGIVFTMSQQLPGAGSDVSRNWGFDVMIGFIHGFRMQLFFFIAGFFGRLLHKRLGTKAFIKQRLKRIGLPFLLSMVTVMPVVLMLAMWGFTRAGQSVEIPKGVRTGGVPTMHLWFLLYLLYLYGIALLIHALAKQVKFSFEFIFKFPMRLILFAPVSAVFLWNGPWWGEPVLGVFGLTPEPSTLAYYGTFFAGGWILHANKASIVALKDHVMLTLAVGLAALGISSVLGHCNYRPIANLLALKCVTLFCAALYAWAMIFASIGIFLRWFPEERPWARYLADASYWCYLAHLPVVMVFQIWIARWAWPAWIKFAIVLGPSMAILLALYEYRVRYTWVGRLLNGPRERVKLDCELLPNKEPSPAS